MSDMVSEVSDPVIRTFATGATRNLDVNKLDYDGFVSPLVLESFAKYMHSHRLQKDGTMRSADNWQKGISLDVYMKSMWRHFFDVWKMHRGHKAFSPEDGHELTMEEALNAMTFNSNGYLHELLKAEAQAALEPVEEERWCHVCALWKPAPRGDKTESSPVVSSVEFDGCDDDMVSIQLPRNIAVVIGVLFVLMFGACAVVQLLSLLSKMQ